MRNRPFFDMTISRSSDCLYDKKEDCYTSSTSKCSDLNFADILEVEEQKLKDDDKDLE